MEDKPNIIKDWLISTGRKQNWLAKKLDVTEGYLSLIATRKQSPSRVLALALEYISDGGIPADQWDPP